MEDQYINVAKASDIPTKVYQSPDGKTIYYVRRGETELRSVTRNCDCDCKCRLGLFINDRQNRWYRIEMPTNLFPVMN